MGKDLISILIVIGIGMVACVSNDEKPTQVSDISAPEQLSYRYEVGESRIEEDPLPNLQPVYVMKSQVSELTRKRIGYKGWDFDKDGQLDMLQVLNLKGRQVATAFDFNGDGEIDMVSAGGKSYFEKERFSKVIPQLAK